MERTKKGKGEYKKEKGRKQKGVRREKEETKWLEEQ